MASRLFLLSGWRFFLWESAEAKTQFYSHCKNMPAPYQPDTVSNVTTSPDTAPKPRKSWGPTALAVIIGGFIAIGALDAAYKKGIELDMIPATAQQKCDVAKEAVARAEQVAQERPSNSARMDVALDEIKMTGACYEAKKQELEKERLENK
jgi:hypothetical protein